MSALFSFYLGFAVSRIMDFRFLSTSKPCVVLAIAFVVIASASRTSCPRQINIERGENMTISCKPDDSQVSATYWYKGDPSHAGPILRREEGIPGGTEYGKGHYDITTEGAMTITDATIDHEGMYYFLIYFEDGVVEKNNFTVNVTITPLHVCPVIENCIPCEDCGIKGNRSQSLMCSITQSRPKITLKWSTIFAKGIEIFQSVQEADKNYITDAWNTSAVISFMASSCDQHAVLQCVAQDDIRVLKYSHSSVNIYTDNCTVENIDIEKELFGTKDIFLSVVLPLCLIAVLMSCFAYFINKRRRTLRRKKKDQNEDSIPAEHIRLFSSQSGHPPPRRKISAEVRQMISKLKEIYRSHCSFRELPFEDPISVDELYVGCQCEVTYFNGQKSEFSSTKLLADTYFRNQQQVLVVGSKGYGKTLLLKNVVKQWIDEEKNNLLLLFVPLKGVSMGTKFTDVVWKNICIHDEINIDQFEEALRTCRCLVLLDSLEDLSLGNELESTNNDGDRCETGISAFQHLTVRDILQTDFIVNNSYMKVWVTSCNLDNTEKMGLKHTCTVELKGFTDEQFEQYIEGAFSYYTNNGERPVCSILNGTDNYPVDGTNGNYDSPSSEEDKEGLINCSSKNGGTSWKDYSKDEICKNIYLFLEKYEIINNFREIPAFLFFISRIIVTDFISTVQNLKDVRTWNIASFTDCIMQRLMSNFTEGREAVKTEETSFPIKVLEDIALKSTFKSVFFVSNESSDSRSKRVIDNAVAIGLLRRKIDDLTNKVKTDEAAGSPKYNALFCQKYFRDYFAACSIAKNPTPLQKLQEEKSKYKESEMLGLVRFICNLQKSKMEEYNKIFLKRSWFNCLIDCLYEANDEEATGRIIREICQKNIIIRSLGGKYHRDAVSYFFEKCKDTKTTLQSMSVWGDFHTSFLDVLPIEFIKNLEFGNRRVTNSEFVTMLTRSAIGEYTKKLSFVQCGFENVAETRDQIGQLKNVKSKPSVYRKEKADIAVWEEFDYGTMKWKVGKFGKFVQNVFVVT